MLNDISDLAANVTDRLSRRTFVTKAGQLALACLAVLGFGRVAFARPKVCRVNGHCGDGEYCDKLACGKGLGLCVPRPDFCTQQFDPVCGCDGRTYPNDCMAAMAGVNVRHKGECRRRRG